MAVAAVNLERAVLFVLRHPMVAVGLTLVLLTTATVGVRSFISRSANEAPTMPASGDSLVAPDTLPSPDVFLDRDEVADVHRALHQFGRACAETGGTPDPRAAAGPLRVIEDFAAKYPNAGFLMDDESGTTFALLIVARNLLETCDPSRLPEIDALLPARYRP